MQARRFLQLAPALSFLACATVDVEKIPTCEPLASLPPLPDVRSCDAQELAEYASVLRKEAIAPASRALIRVQFDDTSRVGAMCVEAAVARDAWSQRRHLAERSDEIANLDPGPRCLAGKRLDLNRYEATFAEIDNAARLCAGQMGPHDECIAQRGDWIVRDRVGWTRPFLYVRPKLAEPPKLSAIETAHRCARASQGFESESECIQAEGFEMLFPPPR